MTGSARSQPRLAAMPEPGLVRQARAGDVEAFTELLRRHDEAMRRLVFAIVRDAWLMDDVLQNAYLKAFRTVGGFRGDSGFGTWLHTVCRTAALDVMRHEARRPHDSLEGPGAADISVDGPATDVTARVDLVNAWRQLPPDQQAALSLVAGDGHSHAEAASVLGIASGTVASRVHRGRDRLRRLLDPPEASRQTAEGTP